MLVLETTNNEVADDNDSDNEDVDNHQNYDDAAILVAQEPVSGKYDKEDLGNNNIMKQTWNACLFIFP